MKNQSFMAIDQYGKCYHDLKYPRRDLLERFGRKHAEKMFVDLKGGGARHIGYVIAGLWLHIYRVSLWKKGL